MKIGSKRKRDIRVTGPLGRRGRFIRRDSKSVYTEHRTQKAFDRV